jgi:hypothetical protein
MLASAIHTTREGKVPAIPRLPVGDNFVRTYAHETVLRMPVADGLSDRKALADFGRRAANVFIDMDDIAAERRDAVAKTRIEQILRESCAAAAPSATQQSPARV